jgi:predicted small lipoprotein YifL
MKKLVASVSALVVAASLTACGGGGGEPAPVAVVAAPTTLKASPTTTAAVTNTPFAFPSGVPDLGTTGLTTITMSTPASSTATGPNFSISSQGQTATGAMAFGSCIFKITDSTFPSTSKLAAGNTIEVSPCDLVVDTSGVPANGTAVTKSIKWDLGAGVSTGEPVTVNVNNGGQLTLNGKSEGTVTLTFVTGG